MKHNTVNKHHVNQSIKTPSFLFLHPFFILYIPYSRCIVYDLISGEPRGSPPILGHAVHLQLLEILIFSTAMHVYAQC